jgi:hypothetical protein
MLTNALLALAPDDEQERRSRLLLGRLVRGAPAGASPNTAAARRLLKPLLRLFYPSLPEPRRRIDLALWAVVVEVSMSRNDAIKPRIAPHARAIGLAAAASGRSPHAVGAERHPLTVEAP